jgi:hypothetical protein
MRLFLGLMCRLRKHVLPLSLVGGMPEAISAPLA